MNPLVSVVVPNYNREKLVLEALQSIVAQTYSPLEVIVVDDGSNDESVKAITYFIDNVKPKEVTITLFRQENKGGNAARNIGILKSKGEFIAFLDSDDLWMDDKIEKQVSKLLTDENAGAVYCGLIEVDSSGMEELSNEPRVYPSGDLSSQLLIKDVTAPTSCYMVRSSAFKKVGMFDLNLKARQDWEMWIRISQEFPILAVSEKLVKYRRHDGERTISDPFREIEAYKQIRKKYSESLNNQSWKIKRMADATYYKRMGRVHFHQKISIVKALNFYLKAIYKNPLDFDAYAAFLGVFIPMSFREYIHKLWNKIFGRSSFAIKSH